MPASRVQETYRFSEPSLYLAFGAIALIAVAGIGSFFTSRMELERRVRASGSEPAILGPVLVEPQTIGALRIDVRALLGRNEWAVFEIQALDATGKVVASAVKGAWSESISGRDPDLQAGLDLRSRQSRELTLVISVLERGDVRTGASPQSLQQPIDFAVRVRSGAIDGRFLWGGLFVSLFFAGATWFQTLTSGRRVIEAVNPDSDAAGRAILGGENIMLRVLAIVLSDETSPPTLKVRLRVSNSQGQTLYRDSQEIRLKFRHNDGEIDGAMGAALFFLTIAERNSYGVSVEVEPDGPIDRTHLVVTEGVRTRGKARVAFVEN
ncbi:hypothetical protein [Rubidibacter lacunae]|uniref:hypothetical protein n=1 Tax=Rubidibacter lacunae TaxID=582514 RepID=UPI0012EB07EF|nr:hypothetical protein [Rubidibacter lacunae]